MPLGRLDLFQNEKMTRLTPEIEYAGDKLLILVPQIASVPSKLLRKPVGSLSHLRDEIIGALDFSITGL